MFKAFHLQAPFFFFHVVAFRFLCHFEYQTPNATAYSLWINCLMKCQVICASHKCFIKKQPSPLPYKVNRLNFTQRQSKNARVPNSNITDAIQAKKANKMISFAPAFFLYIAIRLCKEIIWFQWVRIESTFVLFKKSILLYTEDKHSLQQHKCMFLFFHVISSWWEKTIEKKWERIKKYTRETVCQCVIVSHQTIFYPDDDC